MPEVSTLSGGLKQLAPLNERSGAKAESVPNMSYNNIGLTTPRGSGTSGYVQRNLSHTRRTQDVPQQQNYRREDGIQHRKPDQSIIDHEAKRQIESKCLELELQLEEEGVDDVELIQDRVDLLREKLLRELHAGLGHFSKKNNLTSRPRETHEIAAMKLEENEKFRAALKVEGTYEEGQAFDKEYQATKKARAIEDRLKRANDPLPTNRSYRDKKPYQRPVV